MQICADTLYNRKFVLPIILKAFFIEILTAAIASFELSFHHIMHKSIGGVAMGSPLALALASMLVGYYEEGCFDQLANTFCISTTLMTPLPSSRGNPRSQFSYGNEIFTSLLDLRF